MEDVKFDIPTTPRQVAEQFFHKTLSYYSVLSMAKSGEMPFHKIGGKYFIWPKELAEWLTEKTQKDKAASA